jgi:enediyne biosynthesis protein E4
LIGAVIAAISVRGARAFQGMATPSRAAHPVPKIEANLPPIHVEFRDIAVEAGLTAPNVSGSEARKKYIIETTGTGVAIFDYDNDGLPDIFLVNGTTLEGQHKTTSHLYRNLGNLRFKTSRHKPV